MKKLIIILIIAFFVISAIPKSAKKESYKIREGNSYKIYYQEKDEEYIDTIAIILSTYIPLMQEDFSIEKCKIQVIVYPSMESLKEKFGRDKIKNPMGIYFEEKIHIISPGCFSGSHTEKKEKFWKNGPLIHEMAHFMTAHKTDGKCPLWLDEGIALYYEYKYTGFECGGRGDKVTMDDLMHNFRNIEGADAYRKSFEIVKKMMEGGKEKEILEKIKNVEN